MRGKVTGTVFTLFVIFTHTNDELGQNPFGYYVLQA